MCKLVKSRKKLTHKGLLSRIYEDTYVLFNFINLIVKYGSIDYLSKKCICDARKRELLHYTFAKIK